MQLGEAETLKVGDTVCDCRFKHLKILKITPYSPNDDGEIWDYDLVLEDGINCSAVHCCDLTDTHTEKDHPNESETS